MNARIFLKGCYFTLLGRPSALKPRLEALASNRLLTVLNLHRIEDREEGPYRSLTPRLFCDWLGWLKTVFDIVTFGELGTRSSAGKPLLILSFDDGYKDFIDTVAPILETNGLRANLNVIPDCADNGLPPMNGLLQDFISAAPVSLLRELSVPGMRGKIDADRRAAAGLRASSALKNRPIAEQKAIVETLKPLFERLDGPWATPMMTAADVREVSQAHEIGAHSFEHASMAYETDAYLVADAGRCKTWFRDHVGLDPQIYAFPNGSLREAQPAVVRELGYPFVLDVGERFSRPDATLHPRFTLHADSLGEARFRAVGGRLDPRSSTQKAS